MVQNQSRLDVENTRAQNQDALEDKRASNQLDAEDQRGQDAAVQDYFDRMERLLLDEDLRTSQTTAETDEELDEVSRLARARTLTLLERVDDPYRKRSIIQFLGETGLIEKEPNTLVSLTTANLRGADLSNAPLYKTSLRSTLLEGADLTESDLTNADLTNADLTNADLRGAAVTEEQLNTAWSIEGITRSDG